ncbi:hypothetical protein QJQ45_026668, partial [Haematococcus lacustris]
VVAIDAASAAAHAAQPSNSSVISPSTRAVRAHSLRSNLNWDAVAQQLEDDDEDWERLREDEIADDDRRRREHEDLMVMAVLMQRRPPMRRRWTVRPRSLPFYSTVLMANDIDGQRLVDDDEYVRLFRMGRGTFDWLKSQLEPHIGTRELCAGQRLALALRYLASGATMRVVAADMGRGHATVHEAVHEVCAAIVDELHGMIHMPTTVEELTLSASAFMTAGDGLPQCFAAVDGTHVAVRDLGLRALYNRKGFCSFNVQAVCNGEGLWIAVEVGNAGSMHDARAFSHLCFGSSSASSSSSAGLHCKHIHQRGLQHRKQLGGLQLRWYGLLRLGLEGLHRLALPCQHRRRLRLSSRL